MQRTIYKSTTALLGAAFMFAAVSSAQAHEQMRMVYPAGALCSMDVTFPSDPNHGLNILNGAVVNGASLDMTNAPLETRRATVRCNIPYDKRTPIRTIKVKYAYKSPLLMDCNVGVFSFDQNVVATTVLVAYQALTPLQQGPGIQMAKYILDPLPDDGEFTVDLVCDIPPMADGANGLEDLSGITQIIVGN